MRARCLCFPYGHYRSNQCLALLLVISKALHNLLSFVVMSLSFLTQCSRLAHASYLHPAYFKTSTFSISPVLAFPCRCLAVLNLSGWLKPNPSALLLTLCLHICHKAYRNTKRLLHWLMSNMLSRIISLPLCTPLYANVFSFLLFLSFKTGSLFFAVFVHQPLQ